MATYKVIQDIESEDKLLGPLTLRQFIYAAIVCVMGFIAFQLAAVSVLFIIPFILPMGFFALLAAPFGHDQSSEVWLLAKIGFFLKPRLRIWNQDGMQQLVSITVPKKVEKHLTDGLTQMEVKSRLNALANTIDSRGWAVKNVNVNLSNHPSYLSGGQYESDRLVDGTSLPQDVPTTEIFASDDILDAVNNPTAQHLDTMITQSKQAHRQTLVNTIQNGQAPADPPSDYWFMNQPTTQPNLKDGYAIFDSSSAVLPGTAPVSDPATQTPTIDEQSLLEQLHKENAKPNPAYGHMKVLDPMGSTVSRVQSTESNKESKSSGLSAQDLPADRQDSRLNSGKATIARLASNDDLNISTIAREADKQAKQFPEDEVIISLR